MCRTSCTRLWCNNTQSIRTTPKQNCRSIFSAPKLSHDNYPASIGSSQPGKHGHLGANQTYHSCISDWNSNDEFFNFTRGRFVVDEAENLRKREIRFDLNRLARVAADAVGAAQCISIKKYPDGMFNKSFLISMDNGQEVVAKVPNPNAGVPPFTTASEVATMDFVCSYFT